MTTFQKKLAIATIMSLVGMTSAVAQVTLNVDDNIVVTAINGQEVKTGLFANPKKTYSLEAGKHVITAKYTRLFDLAGDNHDVLRSSNITIPVELADNQSYQLVMVGQPDNYAQAKEYVKKPTLAVMQNGRTLASQQPTDIDGSSGLFGGITNAIGGIFGGGTKAVNANQQTISAINSNTGSIAAIQPAVAQSNTTPTVTSADTLDQFMQLWLKATPAEREKMRQWVQK